MQLDNRERSMLARVGFFLCRDGMVPEAEIIFAGLAKSAPEKDGPVVGLMLCEIIKGECEKAVAMANERLDKGSRLSGPLNLYKLVALGMAGRLAEANDVRANMEKDGLGQDVATADLLLGELSQKAFRKA